jgi:hypothetical protein
METGIQPFLQVEKSARKIARKWGTQYITLNTMQMIIDNVKKNVATLDTAIVGQKMIDQYNRVLDQMFIACKKKAEVMNSPNVSIEYVQKCTKTIVGAYRNEFTKTESK